MDSYSFFGAVLSEIGAVGIWGIVAFTALVLYYAYARNIFEGFRTPSAQTKMEAVLAIIAEMSERTTVSSENQNAQFRQNLVFFEKTSHDTSKMAHNSERAVALLEDILKGQTQIMHSFREWAAVDTALKEWKRDQR